MRELSKGRNSVTGAPVVSRDLKYIIQKPVGSSNRPHQGPLVDKSTNGQAKKNQPDEDLEADGTLINGFPLKASHAHALFPHPPPPSVNYRLD